MCSACITISPLRVEQRRRRIAALLDVRPSAPSGSGPRPSPRRSPAARRSAPGARPDRSSRASIRDRAGSVDRRTIPAARAASTPAARRRRPVDPVPGGGDPAAPGDRSALRAIVRGRPRDGAPHRRRASSARVARDTDGHELELPVGIAVAVAVLVLASKAARSASGSARRAGIGELEGLAPVAQLVASSVALRFGCTERRAGAARRARAASPRSRRRSARRRSAARVRWASRRRGETTSPSAASTPDARGQRIVVDPELLRDRRRVKAARAAEGEQRVAPRIDRRARPWRPAARRTISALATRMIPSAHCGGSRSSRRRAC